MSNTASPAVQRPRDLRLYAGLAIFAVALCAALAPGLFTAQNPLDNDLLSALKPPSAAHPFGTDNIGRDIWSRVVHGASISLSMGLVATAISVSFGALLGLGAGLARPFGRKIAGGLIDILFAFPDLLLALMLLTALGSGPANTAIAIGLSGIPGFARLMQAEVLRLRGSGFIASSATLGIGARAVLLRHLLPNAVGPVIVLGSLFVGKAILYSSALSFLGLGPDRPAPEWGLMLSDAQLYLSIAPWMAIAPGAAIMIVVAASVLVARALRGEKA